MNTLYLPKLKLRLQYISMWTFDFLSTILIEI